MDGFHQCTKVGLTYTLAKCSVTDNVNPRLHYSDVAEELIIILGSLTLVRFSPVDFTQIEQALETGNVADLIEIKKSISFEIVNLSESSTGAVDECFDLVPFYDPLSFGSDQLLLVGSGMCCNRSE
jgi:hypothetical protein